MAQLRVRFQPDGVDFIVLDSATLVKIWESSRKIPASSLKTNQHYCFHDDVNQGRPVKLVEQV